MKRGKTLVLLILLNLLPLHTIHGQGIDYNILCDLQQNRTSFLDDAMQWTSNSLVLAPAMPLSLMVGGKIADNGAVFDAGIASGLSFLVAFGITEGLKMTVRRPRPYNTYVDDLIPLHPVRGYSFPSGHTSLSFSVATSLSLAFPKWYVVVPSMLWASGVGFSRLYLGVHYPSDVLTGALVGAFSAVLTYYMLRQIDDIRFGSSKNAFLIPVTITF